METAQAQSTASEPEVRAAITHGLAPHGATPVEDAPGKLVLESGSVGKAYLAGGFRKGMKMPVRITVETSGGEGGTGLSVTVAGRGGSGFMSGGVMGAVKERNAERNWVQLTLQAVPALVVPEA